MAQRVLFLCTANRCRSPMAACIATSLVQSAGRADFVFESAGTDATDGESATAHAIEVVRLHGGSLAHHHARKVTAEMIDAADVTLCMTRAQVLALAHPRAQLLSVRAGLGDHDIEDPFGRGLAAYRDTYDELELIIRKLLDRGMS